MPLSINTYKLYKTALSILVLLNLSSCISHQKLLNFNEGKEFSSIPDTIPMAAPMTIQPNEEIVVLIQTYDPIATAKFNLGQTTNLLGPTQASNATTGVSYTVNQNGEITMPELGKIKIAGLSTSQAADLIKEKLMPFLKEPVVFVNFKQFRYTVIGEVKIPGAHMLEDRMNILEALGSSGDVTDYANRSNILVIREQKGQRSYGRINLHDREVFKSPYFYLKPNDVIYVEPLKEKTATLADKGTKVLSYISVLSVIINIIVAIRVLR